MLFILGALLALGFAPFYIWPMVAISVSGFYIALRCAPSLRHAARSGFFFGYGFFIAGTYWISYSLLVDAKSFGWMVPFAIFGLNAVLAIYFVLLAVIVFALRSNREVVSMLCFIIAWVAIEYARSYGMFGFPWNLLGYSVAFSDRLSQAAALIGAQGLTIPVLVFSLIPASFLLSYRYAWQHLILGLVLAIGMYGYGMWRMPEQAALSDMRVRVVQPNIPQEIKWSPEGKIDTMQRLTQLSHIRTDGAIPSVIIWPETALPYVLDGSENWKHMLAYLVPPETTLITGALRIGNNAETLYNSVVAVAPDSKSVSYDKHQLVPFGEFVPLRNILPLNKITPGTTDFSRGAGAVTLSHARTGRFSPLICYEAVFPDMAINKAARPQWLLNVTNDAWFGNSPGPFQHADMVRFRAIEQGLPLVRAANTGISMVTDPYGRVLKSLPLDETGVIDQTLPKALPETFYSQAPVLLYVFLLILALLSRAFKNNPQNYFD